MARILLVEDNVDLAFGLRNNLEIEGYEVIVASDGECGLELAGQSDPDLLILDLMLPKLDGFRILHELRSAGAKFPILILTARGEETDKVRGLRLGADDYVTKPFGVLELLARVEALLRRSGNGSALGTDRRVIEFGSVRIDTSSRTVTRDHEIVSLTPKEYDLLIALIDRQGAIASRFELLQEVWGYDSSVLSRTVDTHIAELRRKLEADPSSPQHILTVRKVGYRLSSG